MRSCTSLHRHRSGALAARLVQSVRATADAEATQAHRGFPIASVAGLVSTAELEELRGRLRFCLRCRSDRPWGATICSPPSRYSDVVAATFPVVLPFALIGDVGTAKTVSRAPELDRRYLV